MRVPNLVPIGPQTATCIRLEGYTHRHTLSYIDIDLVAVRHLKLLKLNVLSIKLHNNFHVASFE